MHKRCFKCLCEKPIDEFYKHSRMADGHLNKCKECTKADANAHRQENLEKIRSYDRLRGGVAHRIAARKRYQKTDAAKESHRAALSKYRKQNPERTRARSAVARAIRKGLLTPQVCHCCGASAEAHHPDYSAPLDVVWLCVGHHAEAHKLTRELQREAV